MRHVRPWSWCNVNHDLWLPLNQPPFFLFSIGAIVPVIALLFADGASAIVAALFSAAAQSVGGAAITFLHRRIARDGSLLKPFGD